MNFLSIIEKKRDGKELASAEISEFVASFTAGQIPDYQVSAFLMAVFFRGLNSVETSALTLAMRDSGDVLHLSRDLRPLVDKHSTGGVGDKVSLPLAPLLACLGMRVPMISGRGLGITGGTLDKLDSIPGFQTLLTTERIEEILRRTGCLICGQTDRMVPADKGLYALRDVTATVPSQSLIVASILSKKLAESLDALVLDVKFGAAAFMPTLDAARELAGAMVDLGNRCGVKTRAILSNMDSPLGASAGNWLEVRESVDCLNGAGPEDLRSLVVESAAHLLVLTKKAASLETARRDALQCLDSGRPARKWREMLAAQGADLDAYDKKLLADSPCAIVEVRAAREGVVAGCDARMLGEVVRDLGGGRLTKESRINYDVGVDRIAKPGSVVRAGGILARVHAFDHATATSAAARVRQAFRLEADFQPTPLVSEVVLEPA